MRGKTDPFTSVFSRSSAGKGRNRGDETMSTISIEIPVWSLVVLLVLSFCVTSILICQIAFGLVNGLRYARRKALTSQRSIFNLYLFHHLFISALRSIVVWIICAFLLLADRCFTWEYFLHFLLLLSSFDLFLIIVGEIAHFWDSTINHASTLYSKCFLLFGLFSVYFVSSLFLSIHITMGGDNPFIFVLCQNIERKFFVNSSELEQSLIPTIILYVLFWLLNLLTLFWIYISHNDIAKLRRKRLATVFFYSLVFTKFKETERMAMVDSSLKRLLAISLFTLSNMLAILPILTLKVFRVTWTPPFYLCLICLSALPWCEAFTCLLFPEFRYYPIRNPIRSAKEQILQQQIGSRLSSYSETRLDLRRDETY